ncbi:alpha-amylase family protein [Vibrio algarum]|uniref:Alpha-amylase n=1 Tax=Vibrio algarum TaxID=3020714 RepID=A0ABT4YWC5_9VIBR|nr:alpha-amylase family protein [Vibrio sp. KJ40-1]MDB1125888.1 alpha-amylase family protein [Vibrio sp. KJ40-1]
MLHAFDWQYSDVTKNAKQISELGYKTVLVSPPMKSAIHKDGTQWWQRYQPQDYRVIDNQLGNTKDFITMVQTLSEFGVRVYADVVFNHMANEAYLRPDLDYPNEFDRQSYRTHWEEFQKLKLFGDLSQPLFTEDDFVEAFGIEDWKDKWQVQNGRITGGKEDPGLPTLRDNEHVVKQQQAYLKALKKMGVAGFRIDAAKHMTLEHLCKVWTEEIMQDVHIFGEIITDGGATKEEYEIFLQPYLESTQLGAYDFPLFNTVFEAFKPSGDMTSLINPYTFGQALSNNRAITFVITHDIPNNDVFLNLIMDETSEWLAYCYILGRDGGVPLIYTDLDTSGIRDIKGQPRWLNAWKDPKMAKMIAFHNYAHGEPMKRVLGDEDFLILSRGDKGLVAINKSDKTIEISIDWQKDMYDLLTDSEMKVDKGEFNFTLEPQSCKMMIIAD